MDVDNNYQYLLEDAVFGHVFSEPKYCLWLLQSIFPDLDIKQVKVTPQKVIKDKLNERGSRFDVWAIDQLGRGFDIELQKNREYHIGQRFRYYQHQANQEILKPGQDFNQIRPTYIIFLSPFDPFDSDKCQYRIYDIYDPEKPKNEVITDDHWYYLNSSGKKGGDQLDKALRDFFAYFHGKINLENEYIKEINQEVGNFIDSTEWGGQNMNLEMLREDATLDAEVEDMKKTIDLFRQYDSKVKDQQLVDMLVKKYTPTFTKKRIERLVKTGK